MRKAYDFSRGKRGALVKIPAGKTRITIRLDDDVLAWFKRQVHKSGGGNYQSLINTALREHMKRTEEPWRPRFGAYCARSLAAPIDADAGLR